jgi:UDP-N-acetylmuramyl tripeptide synthase
MNHEVVGKLRARVAAWRHRNPSHALKLIAVAGQSGKTTTVLLLGELLQEAGSSVVTLTSQGCFHNGQPVADHYDGSAEAFQQVLTLAKKKSADYVVIEVSDALVATHILPTLLITMSLVTNDAPAAQSLLDQPVDYTVVPSGFDVAGLRVAPHQAISFGTDETAEAQLAKVTERRKGTEIEMVIDHQTKLDVATYLVGEANAWNVAAAVSAAYVLAAATDSFAEGVARIESVSGNYQYLNVGERPYAVVVDGAVTDRSINLVLGSAAKLKRRRLLVVADQSVSSEHYPLIKRLADRAVVTGESLELPGVERADDLQAALELCLRGAKKDDLVMLMGRQFAALLPGGHTKAQQMLDETSE